MGTIKQTKSYISQIVTVVLDHSRVWQGSLRHDVCTRSHASVVQRSSVGTALQVIAHVLSAHASPCMRFRACCIYYRDALHPIANVSWPRLNLCKLSCAPWQMTPTVFPCLCVQHAFHSTSLKIGTAWTTLELHMGRSHNPCPVQSTCATDAPTEAQYCSSLDRTRETISTCRKHHELMLRCHELMLAAMQNRLGMLA